MARSTEWHRICCTASRLELHGLITVCYGLDVITHPLTLLVDSGLCVN